MRTFVRILGFVGLALIAPSVSYAAEKADLRPKFKEGQTTYFRDATKITQSMAMGEQTMEVPMNIESGMRVKVVQVRPEGGATVELTYLYVSFEGGPPQMPMSYDSRKKDAAANPMLSGLGGLVDKPITLTLSAGGKVEKVEGTERIKSSVAAGGPAAQIVENMVSDDSLRKLRLYPSEGAPNPAEVGATWKEETETDMGGMATVVINANYTLKKIDSASNTAEIESSSTYKTKATEGAPSMVSIEDSKSQGHTTADLKTGELTRATEDTEMSMKFNAPGAPEGGTKMKQKIHSTVERVALSDLNLPAEAPEKKPETPEKK
ncbi:MAG TPA: DUF6263 family protein [Phycisphaerae bacterium]|jgi:hypothetical protein